MKDKYFPLKEAGGGDSRIKVATLEANQQSARGAKGQAGKVRVCPLALKLPFPHRHTLNTHSEHSDFIKMARRCANVVPIGDTDCRINPAGNAAG